MQVAIVGYGTEGQASCAYYMGLGAAVTVCDQNEQAVVPDGVHTQLGIQYLDNLGRFDVIVRTAGMHPNIILERNPGVEAKMTTQINEFLRVCPTKNIIGVTGTKGKGTTCTLITKMLETAGKQVFLGGNIGIPVLGFLPQLNEESWVVLELSSFQLIDVQHSPHIAVCLMVVPEHLNWHADMAEYMAAKSCLFAQQQPDDYAIYFAGSDNATQIASAGAGQKLPYFTPPGAVVEDGVITIAGQAVCETAAIRLPGKHNWQNACAAVTAVWQTGVHDTAAMRSVLTSFSGLEHHLELVREVDGVGYYDDSFGTTPETAIVALETFRQPKVLILGGSDKGAHYDELAEAVVANNVQHVLLIGEQAGRIQAALEAAGFSDYSPGGTTMTEIITNARSVAKSGDIVLLSTACASFDMFKDYKDRGNQFKVAVSSLS